MGEGSADSAGRRYHYGNLRLISSDPDRVWDKDAIDNLPTPHLVIRVLLFNGYMYLHLSSKKSGCECYLS